MGAVTGIDTNSLASARPGSEAQAITTASKPSRSPCCTADSNWFMSSDAAGRNAVSGTPVPASERTTNSVSELSTGRTTSSTSSS